ncbi:Supv3l1 [Symbiodinium natans]|uniref:Supv3l1 protein n=1 Tax=Symbiodinium natans TaxID=878477 RepID=A0A812HLS6_9DINO|nr:Supv3l1 [Symbiodinium natans]
MARRSSSVLLAAALMAAVAVFIISLGPAVLFWIYFNKCGRCEEPDGDRFIASLQCAAVQLPGEKCESASTDFPSFERNMMLQHGTLVLRFCLTHPRGQMAAGKLLLRLLATSTMARRSSSVLLAAALMAAAFWGFSCFVAPKGEPVVEQPQLRGQAPVEAALLGAAAAAVPQVALAGNSGYALLQLGWAVFIISLGPAVLFWIYFNKPELL